ncbi:hypothetical protein PtrSN002B_007702 [Pyrenophora tritici-repentis]|uniref:Uncharacterized protein n=2 Tax=Pyrenophora tritici-repentis TaxID=45151 RepID=A0A2W1DTR1_9PLEO|nr:uncharacterized protein PTRG_09896 [Pyrenophora tritici-repentis Pt-1C-BFP]KAA8621731.1 hypothetical protein PtrV1_06232 [Pyrenophora tritici-repentis]EDU42947.1 predicted protein [Pyrenophora tritici-repentis Pt-1C-BFP]KAF7450954.1 hypothetical protein A1F99_055700 [Pyrenophora tritici-repentis]KAF7573628.1 hypothetical protein PtrM4_085330 [Pyrenophora tritici-repentis]KAG9380833.1 hypothetical protein A1F94_008153 [Pyrenophora tritici-repentis]
MPIYMPDTYMPDMASMLPVQKQPYASSQYGHEMRFASKCGHNIHPSSAQHTPWCSPCAVSQAKAKTEVALQKVVTEGGLLPPDYMRTQRWNRAKKAYHIARDRLDRARRNEQLRWEREQAWNFAHERFDFQRTQAAAVLPETCSLCPACDSMVAYYPTNIPEAQVAAYAAWWERSGALSTTTPISRCSTTLSPHHNQNRRCAQTTEGNPSLRQAVQTLRNETRKRERLEQGWYERTTMDRAVRSKYNLGPEYTIAQEFWNIPLSLLLSRQVYEYSINQARLAQRNARGQTRPIPPRSPLSHSLSSEDLQADADLAARLYEQEENERLERQVKKIAKEISYLYFVGNKKTGMAEWNEAFEESNKTLVVRVREFSYESSDSSSSGENMDDVDDNHEDMEIDEP